MTICLAEMTYPIYLSSYSGRSEYLFFLISFPYPYLILYTIPFNLESNTGFPLALAPSVGAPMLVLWGQSSAWFR